MKSRRMYRGAVVGEVKPAQAMATALHPHVKHYSDEGFALAMANRHKSWARRWARTHRPGKFI